MSSGLLLLTLVLFDNSILRLAWETWPNHELAAIYVDRNDGVISQVQTTNNASIESIFQ